MEPIITLWHWTNPLWISEIWWWENKDIYKYFWEFTKIVWNELWNDVKYRLTINEPEVFTGYAYYEWIRPPNKKSAFLFIKVVNNLIKAHIESYKLLKSINTDFQIWMSKNNTLFEAYNWYFLNKLKKWFADYVWNYYILDKINKYQDFIWLNYYFHNRINWKFNQNENLITSDLWRELYPWWIYDVLIDLKNRYNKPIMIVENGLADYADEKRELYIRETLKSTYNAICEEVEVLWYLHWSLLDNFEWDQRKRPRFGLVEIDYESMERKVRSSANYYSNIIKNNWIVDEKN